MIRHHSRQEGATKRNAFGAGDASLTCLRRAFGRLNPCFSAMRKSAAAKGTMCTEEHTSTERCQALLSTVLTTG